MVKTRFMSQDLQDLQDLDLELKYNLVIKWEIWAPVFTMCGLGSKASHPNWTESRYGHELWKSRWILFESGALKPEISIRAFNELDGPDDGLHLWQN